MAAPRSTPTRARRHAPTRVASAVVPGLALILTAGCAGSSGPVATLVPTTLRVGNTDVYTYQLVCPSAVGDLSTSLQYTVTDSIEDVRTGETVSYSINAPLAQVKAPVTPTFVSSTTTFAVPAGFNATSATMNPTANADFTSTSTSVKDGTVAFTINGSFPLDGSSRTVPTLVVTGTVTATNGQDIVWNTPTSVVGQASIPILGTQTSSCSFPTAGPIGMTNVT